MGWRYDVFECNNETDDHNTCEAFGGPPKDLFWNDRWKDAYRLAESLPHAVVIREYKGDQGWSGKSVTVFEHVEGGATCYACREARGPLCKGADRNVFICDGCRAGLRGEHERYARLLGTGPSQFTWVPIIETLDL